MDRADRGETEGILEGDVLVDGHVHLHDCYDVGLFLDAAVRNFRAAAWDLGLEPALEGCLLLADCAGAEAFQRMGKQRLPVSNGAWSVRDTGEPASLLVQRRDGARLLLVAGRQIVTGEGIEVLALGSEARFQDGRPVRETLQNVRAAHALSVLPWGFGKWRFHRGEVVAAALEEERNARLFLGDNGGRPRMTPDPQLFRMGSALGVRVLPGSDPLPMAWQVRHVARYGFVIEDVAAWAGPARSLVRAILESNVQPRFFGSREWIGGCLRAQVSLRWRSLAGRREEAEAEAELESKAGAGAISGTIRGANRGASAAPPSSAHGRAPVGERVGEASPHG